MFSYLSARGPRVRPNALNRRSVAFAPRCRLSEHQSERRAAMRTDRDDATPAATPERAIVGVFDDRIAAEEAVDALHNAGFAHDRIGYAIRGAEDVAGGMITDATGTKD